MIVATVAVVGASYRILIPASGEEGPEQDIYPADHGLANLATLQLAERAERYYECWIAWASDNTDELKISSDFLLTPDESAGWWGIRIESSRWPTTLAVIDGSWVMRHGPPENPGTFYPPNACPHPR